MISRIPAIGLLGLASLSCESHPNVDFQQVPQPMRTVYTNPLDDATAVSRTARVDAAFSTEVDPASITAATFLLESSDGSPVLGTVEGTGTIASFTPSAPLVPNHRYTASLTAVVRGASGAPLENAGPWSFTTETQGSEPAPIAFRAHPSAAQSFASGDGAPPIRFQTEDVDLGGHFAFDAVIGTEVFVVPEDGVYSFTFGVGKEQGINTLLVAYLTSSTGHLGLSSQVWAGAGGGWRTNGAWSGTLLAGTKVWVLAETTDAVSRPTDPASYYTQFSGFRVR